MPTIYDVENLLKNVVAERDLLRQKCEVLERLANGKWDTFEEYQSLRAELAALDKRLKGE